MDDRVVDEQVILLDTKVVAAVTSDSHVVWLVCLSTGSLNYADWLVDRPDLWAAGGSVQREVFAETLMRSKFSPAKQD